MGEPQPPPFPLGPFLVGIEYKPGNDEAVLLENKTCRILRVGDVPVAFCSGLNVEESEALIAIIGEEPEDDVGPPENITFWLRFLPGGGIGTFTEQKWLVTYYSSDLDDGQINFKFPE